jgi:hypothetical protein
MGLPMYRLSGRLPRRFPVGAKYVVEGYAGDEGKLRVIARYVVLPGGRRINVPADLSQPVSARARAFRCSSSDPRPKADPKASAKNSPRVAEPGSDPTLTANAMGSSMARVFQIT